LQVSLLLPLFLELLLVLLPLLPLLLLLLLLQSIHCILRSSTT
jgi:hypothetical protein